ncbi:MAG: hypothetical protein VB140_10400 [Burkholderia sp.]
MPVNVNCSRSIDATQCPSIPPHEGAARWPADTPPVRRSVLSRNSFVSPEIMIVDAITSSRSIYATTPLRRLTPEPYWSRRRGLPHLEGAARGWEIPFFDIAFATRHLFTHSNFKRAK